MVITEWRDAPGFPGYKVSSTGLVVSQKRWGLNRVSVNYPGRLLSTQLDRDGYVRVALMRDGRTHYGVSVARLVCEAWHGAPRNSAVVRHLDGSRANNTPDNLAWGSHKDNVHDAIAHGTFVRGERVHTAKLTAAQARQIFADARSNAAIAADFKITPGAVWFIKTKRSWVHACKDMY
jgi:hypothetical protein